MKVATDCCYRAARVAVSSESRMNMKDSESGSTRYIMWLDRVSMEHQRTKLLGSLAVIKYLSKTAEGYHTTYISSPILQILRNTAVLSHLKTSKHGRKFRAYA